MEPSISRPVRAQTQLEAETVRGFVEAIQRDVLFVLHLPDGQQIRLKLDGPEGISGTGIKFENRLAPLLLLLPREVRA